MKLKEDEVKKVKDYFLKRITQPAVLSLTDVSNSIGINVNKVREIVRKLIADGFIIREKLPKTQCNGYRFEYSLCC